MRKAIVALLMLLVASFASADLIVTELMYNSPGTDVEWVELYNDSDVALDLTGLFILDDNIEHDPVPLEGTLDAYGVLVVVGDFELFNAQYPEVTNTNPTAFQGFWALGNGGDGVLIVDGALNIVYSMEYDDGGDWPGECDGDGPALELVAIGGDYHDFSSWMASAEDYGTPGTTPFAPVATDNTSFSTLKALY